MSLSRKWEGICLAILMAGLFVSCANKPSQKYEGEPYTPMAEESFASRALSDWVAPEIAKRPSWKQYQNALQAMENEDWLLARHHLDIALKDLVVENHDSLYSAGTRPQDSLYRKEMPAKIIRALDEIYPHLAELGEDASKYVRYDFEEEGHEGLDEPPLDSSQRVEIQSFLDTLDLSQFSLPVELNDRVMQEIFYMTHGARAFTEGSLSRKTALDSMIYAKLKERGMPADLIYLALVESGFKQKAYSRAKASGLWQFIPATGKHYGLEVDYWVDMRRNPVMATDAALSYLTKLHDEFGDWLLAMAAYNCGEGRVRRLVRNANAAAAAAMPDIPAADSVDIGTEDDSVTEDSSVVDDSFVSDEADADSGNVDIPADDSVASVPAAPVADTVATAPVVAKVSYWDLALPRETMHYVPRILAAMIVGHYPEHYGMKIEPAALPAYDTVTVTECFPLDKVAEILDVSSQAIMDLNMELSRMYTPPQRNYTLRIPVGTRDEFLAVYEKMDKHQASRWQSYKVQRKDNLGSIARKFGISISSIKKANRLRSNRIHQGQTLMIPLPGPSVRYSIPAGAKVKASANGRTYEVKAGDNLASIGRAFGISILKLQTWNHLDGSDIKAGDTLYLAEPPLQTIASDDDDAAPVDASKPAPAVFKGGTYIVRPGDTYSSIAAAQGISRETLMELNSATSGRLYVGQSLRVPAPQPGSRSENRTSVSSRTHKVSRGETLFSIARRYGVSVSDLQAWNGLGKKSAIHAGQKLKISAASSVSTHSKASDASRPVLSGKRRHVVKSGESLWDISRKYGVTIQQIVEWNNLKDTKVKPGESLLIEK